MTEAEINLIKEIINEQIKGVEGDIERYKVLAQPVQPDNAIGRVSRMEAIGEKSINESNLKKSQKRLQELHKAKTRTESEDYGLCLECEEEIPFKRLEILPESQICIKCLNKINR